jgi:hypothetical protein
MRDVVAGVGVVQPPVQQAEPVVELGTHDVSRRHGDAELAQRCHAELDGFGSNELISGAKQISQFLDRDTRPDFASTVMIPALQDFIKNPDDIDGLCSSIEQQKKTIFV